jgi:hypothetical protein
MNWARRRISGEGEWVKEWKRLSGCRSTRFESFAGALEGAAEDWGGGTLAVVLCCCASTAGLPTRVVVWSFRSSLEDRWVAVEAKARREADGMAVLRAVDVAEDTVSRKHRLHIGIEAMAVRCARSVRLLEELEDQEDVKSGRSESRLLTKLIEIH